jgi:hypothetical protein
VPVFFGAARDHNAVVLEKQMMVWRCDIDLADPDLFAIGRMFCWKGASIAQYLRQPAYLVRRYMQYDE